MTTSVASLIDRARIVLQDKKITVRWSDEELVYWLNDGQREVVNLKPEANAVNQAILLAAGTQQRLPDGAVQFFSLTRNLGFDGLTAGTAIRLVDKAALDAAVPNWHLAAPAAEVLECMADPLDPLRYSIYPPNVGGYYVEAVFSNTPADTTLNGNISLPDIYSNALLNYMLFRGYSKDAEHAANAALAASSYSLFVNGVTGRAQAEASRNASRGA